MQPAKTALLPLIYSLNIFYTLHEPPYAKKFQKMLPLRYINHLRQATAHRSKLWLYLSRNRTFLYNTSNGPESKLAFASLFALQELRMCNGVELLLAFVRRQILFHPGSLA